MENSEQSPQPVELLSQLFEAWNGQPAKEIIPLPPSGSSRRYFRLKHGDAAAMGVWNKDAAENKAFIEFSKHFAQKGIAVPEIYATNEGEFVYLQQDLGDLTLFDHLQKSRKGDTVPANIRTLYQKSLSELAKIQILGFQGLDLELCYPRKEFDRQSIQWDLNYFKYYALKLSGVHFEEQKLENDFQQLTDRLLEAENDFFMFRDFQARNIMVTGPESIAFIDYQGGRKGALQYDLVSLLWQAKADLPHAFREEMVGFYLDEASQLTEIDRIKFREYYFLFVYARVLQVLGAYGYRGVFERKPHFLTSIPFALRNLEWLLQNAPLPENFASLPVYLQALVDSPSWKDVAPRPVADAPLTVTIRSFSYKAGIPEDHSGHGGGFVFDCRSIHNPGRYTPYKKLTGRDKPVKDFLEETSGIQDFLNPVFSIVGKAVQVYLDRGFEHLSVNFGCTGGQHRSVYSADALAAYLEKNYKVKTAVEHVEQEKKNWINE